MSYKRIYFLLLLLIIAFGFNLNAFAQSEQVSKSKLVINSNYESFYVLVDDSIKNAVKRESREMFEIESGDRTIWVIPEYSRPYTFSVNLEPDSIFSVGLVFNSLLEKRSEVYERIVRNDSSFLTLRSFPFKRNTNTSYLGKRFTKDAYVKNLNAIKNFKDTYVKVISNVDSLYINPTKDVNNTLRIANGDSILVLPGLRTITISHERSKEYKAEVSIPDSSTTIIQHDFILKNPSIRSLRNNIATQPYYKSNLIIISDRDSRIIVNETYTDSVAIALDMKTEPISIIVENPYTKRNFFKTEIRNTTFDKATVISAYTKPSKKVAILFSPLPGAAQLYKRERTKGYIISSGFIISSLSALITNQRYRDELITYDILLNQYNLARNEDMVFEAAELVNKQLNVVSKLNTQRKIFYYTAISFYLYNVYDAIFTKPYGGYRTKTNIDIYLNNDVINNSSYTSLSLLYDF